MKAEKTRKLLNDCGSCGASCQDCAICFDNSQHILDKRIDDELTELERLAEIGRYIKMAFSSVYDGTIEVSKYGEKGHFIGTEQLDNVNELIKWGREQKDGESVEG